jgi:hypothetical protein
MNWKEFRRKLLWSSWGIWLEGLKKTTTYVSQDIRFSGWDLTRRFRNTNLQHYLQTRLHGKRKRQSYPYNRPRRHIGLWDVDAPTLSRQSAHRWRWGQPYTPAALYLPGRFVVLISVIGWVESRATVWLEGLGQLKNSMISSGIEPAIFRLLA